MPHPLSPLFSPQGVALIGTSASPNKLSHGILKNMVEGNFQGEIYPVNPKYDQVLGLKCYPEIASLPEPVELAVIALPAPAVRGTIDECGRRGIRSAVIISGGFREIGPEGRQLEDDCIATARKYGMRVIGPNCVGTMDLYSGLNTTFIKGLPEKGRIGFLSQSGAICGGVVDYVRGKDIGFSMFASLGNMADVNETDMIEYLATDPNTYVIALYLEGIQDGRRFIDVASKVSKVKPIVVLKVGRSSAGARAVSSHTGSLAGAYAAYEAAFRQSGVLTVDSAEELFDVALTLDYLSAPKGNRVAIVTNSGGPAALASDSLAANGMALADLTQDTQQELRAGLVPSAQVANPVDMLGGAEPREYDVAMKACLKDPQVDSVVAILTPQALVNPAEVARVIGNASANQTKPVTACFLGGESVNEARHVLNQLRVPMFIFPEQCGRALGALQRFSRLSSRSIAADSAPRGIDKKAATAIMARCEGQHALGEADVRPLLQAYGLPLVSGDVSTSPDEAARLAAKIGFPVVLKIVSPDLLHKSDAGGVALNLKDEAAVKAAYTQITEKIHRDFPTARLEGLLVEKMAPKGTEVIVGMRRDSTFGPLMMFGMGGIFVELLTDVSFGIAPLTRDEALSMIQATKAGKLLNGMRGQKASDVGAIVDTMVKLAQLSLDFPEIDEIEVNPLSVYEDGQGVVALDARAILK